MRKKENFTKSYFRLIALAIPIFGLFACGAECYEDQEPAVYIDIWNSCQYKQVAADGMLRKLEIANDCSENKGSVEITLPLSEQRKTYFFTDGTNTIDSITLDYKLIEDYQGNGCGYIVRLDYLSLDTNASSLPFFHSYELDSSNADTLHPYISYTTFSDYMRFYY